MVAQPASEEVPEPMRGDTLTTHILAQIRDNLSAINKKQDKIAEDVTTVNIRVVKLEEQDARLKRLEEADKVQDAKIDVLMRDKDTRAGASTVFVGIRGWTPVVIAILSATASIFTALYLTGRAAGVVAAPPGYIAQKPPEHAVEQPEHSSAPHAHP
jgi:hypothetical protein